MTAPSSSSAAATSSACSASARRERRDFLRSERSLFGIARQNLRRRPGDRRLRVTLAWKKDSARGRELTSAKCAAWTRRPALRRAELAAQRTATTAAPPTMVKIKAISRDRRDFTRERKGELMRVSRNPQPELHPFERAREYTRIRPHARARRHVRRASQRVVESREANNASSSSSGPVRRRSHAHRPRPGSPASLAALLPTGTRSMRRARATTSQSWRARGTTTAHCSTESSRTS